MRRRWSTLAAAAVLLLASASRAAENDLFLLSYFKDNGQAGVFLAASEDGLQFSDLNGGRPIFAPPQWPEQNLTRDPSIVYRDGLFRMVWTSSWTGGVFGAATSPDLKTWSEPVQVSPFAGTQWEDDLRNVWPIFYSFR